MHQGQEPLQKSVNPVNTQKELAKIAGVSHDTIHKVEVIKNSGDQKLINDVRSGETTINRAYQVVKGIDPIKTKTPAQMLLKRPVQVFFFMKLLICSCLCHATFFLGAEELFQFRYQIFRFNRTCFYCCNTINELHWSRSSNRIYQN